MDLLKILFDVNRLRNTCCLCLNFGENCTNNSDVIEIVNKQFNLEISIRSLIKTTLPYHETFLNQTCVSCVNIIVKLFIILKNSYIKTHFLSLCLKNINESIDNVDPKIKMATLGLSFQAVLDENKERYVCHDCHMAFMSKEILEKHINDAHKLYSEVKICYICSKRCPTSRNLRSHLKNHTYKPCPYSPKLLKSQAHFNKHIRSHLKCTEDVDGNNIGMVENSSTVGIKYAIKTLSANEQMARNYANNNKNHIDPAVSNVIETLSQNKIEKIYGKRSSEENFAYTSSNNNSNRNTFMHNNNDTNMAVIYFEKSKIYNDKFKPLNSQVLICGEDKEVTSQTDNTNNSIDLDYNPSESLCELNKDKIDETYKYQHSDNNGKIDSFSLQQNKVKNWNNNRESNKTESNDPAKYKLKDFKKYYLCEICPYKCLAKSNLEGHTNKVHLKIRPYLCHVCSKRFYRKNNLQEHIMTHYNTKNLTCQVCGGNFVSKKTLKVHFKSHNVGVKYQCDLCNKFFVYKHHLNEHIKRIHMEKLVSCPLCVKKYGLKKDLNRHIAKMHQINAIQ